MAKREIITLDEGLSEEEFHSRWVKLGQRADEVDVLTQNREVREIIADIKAVMREKNLVSLSAVALGHDKRIFCIKFDGDIKAFVNPIISHASKQLSLSRERCSSIPGKEFILPRDNDISVCYQKATGEVEERRFIGLAAIVYQHEIGHLEGLLISDIGLEVPENFDNFTDDEKEGLISEYLDSLDLMKKQFEEEYETDKEFKQLKDGVDFMESVVKGETKLVPAPETRIPENSEEE